MCRYELDLAQILLPTSIESAINAITCRFTDRRRCLLLPHHRPAGVHVTLDRRPLIAAHLGRVTWIDNGMTIFISPALALKRELQRKERGYRGPSEQVRAEISVLVETVVVCRNNTNLSGAPIHRRPNVCNFKAPAPTTSSLL
jgi:hypothetical protein